MAKKPIEFIGEMVGLKSKADKRGDKIELVVRVKFGKEMMSDLAGAFNREVGVTLTVDPKQPDLPGT